MIRRCFRWVATALLGLFSTGMGEIPWSAEPGVSHPSGGGSPARIVLPHAAIDQPYCVPLALAGAEGNVDCRVIQGRLPPGIALEKFFLRGIPTKLGEYIFTIQAEDEAGQTAQASFQIKVMLPPADPLTIPKTSLPPCIVCTYYQVSLPYQGGYGPYQWRLLQGQLPEGLQLKDHLLTGQVRKFLHQPETHSFQVEVRDRLQQTATQTFTITLLPNEEIRLRIGAWGKKKNMDSRTELPPAIVGKPYLAHLPFRGGYGPLRLDCPAEQLPPGLELTEAALEGTPHKVGLWHFTVSVQDSLGQQLQVPMSLQVLDPPPPPLRVISPQLPPARVGQSYRADWKAEGGYPPYTWSLEGELPRWLHFQNGSLWGTPPDVSALGEYLFTIHLQDAHGSKCPPVPVKLLVQLPPSLPPPRIFSRPLPMAIVEQPYQTGLLFQGGLPPYQIQLLQGGLPPGLQLLPTGHLIGTVEKEGDWDFAIQIMDSLGQSSPVQSLHLTARRIAKPTLQLSACPVLSGVVGKELRAQFGASGGVLPYRFSMLGDLPPGLEFQSDKGILCGTPTTRGNWKLRLNVQDSSPVPEEVSASINIVILPLPPWGIARGLFWAGCLFLILSLAGWIVLWIRRQNFPQHPPHASFSSAPFSPPNIPSDTSATPS